MPLIRIITIFILLSLTIFSYFEYREIKNIDYYKIVKDNKETMIDILSLSNEIDKSKDLLYCSSIKEDLYKFKQKLFDKGFLDTIFFGFNYGKYNPIYSKHYVVDIYYYDNTDFSFCISKENDLNYKENNEELFEYLPDNTIINTFEKCKGGHELGESRMFKIKDSKLYYCEK